MPFHLDLSNIFPLGLMEIIGFEGILRENTPAKEDFLWFIRPKFITRI